MKDYTKFIERNYGNYPILAEEINQAFTTTISRFCPKLIKSYWPQMPEEFSDLLAHFPTKTISDQKRIELFTQLFNFMQENYPEVFI